jgi:hypothetical protein
VSDESKERSVAQKTGGLTVAASPFNAVKVQLGLILVGALLLLLLHNHLSDDVDVQLAILAAYGVISALWLVREVKKVEKTVLSQDE